MDNTELHYVTYDPNEIYAAMVAEYMAQGGEAIKPGEEIDLYFHAVLAILVQAFAGVDNGLRMGTLRYAVGDYLDVIGENRFCERIAAAAATATATFTFSASASGTISAGTVITADGDLLWETDDDITMSASGTMDVGITCTETGTAGNVLTAETAMQMLVPVSGVESIVIKTAASGGAEKEDDDTYRDRIREYGLSAVTTGTKNQYESLARTVEGVKDAQAVLNGSSGYINVYVAMLDGYTWSTVFFGVEDAVDNDTVKPLQDTVMVQRAGSTVKIFDAAITLPKNATAAMKNAITEAVNEYLEWQNAKIARTIIPARLAGMIYQAGAESVTLKDNETQEVVTDNISVVDGSIPEVYVNITFS